MSYRERLARELKSFGFEVLVTPETVSASHRGFTLLVDYRRNVIEASAPGLDRPFSEPFDNEYHSHAHPIRVISHLLSR